MIELFYFVGGVVMSGIICLVYAVLSTARKTNELKVNINYINDSIRDTHSIISSDRKELLSIIENNVNDIYGRLNENDSLLDSRLDKLESRLTKLYKDGCEPVKKQIID
jgi:Flp pilus assembly CpaF family ATPase